MYYVHTFHYFKGYNVRDSSWEFKPPLFDKHKHVTTDLISSIETFDTTGVNICTTSVMTLTSTRVPSKLTQSGEIAEHFKEKCRH